MSFPSYRFIDPKALAAVRDLELISRTVVDGFMYGVHPSRMPGAGLEFNQYRSYQPGDDLRRVDWKLLGRSDRYFIRESESETSLTVRLLLDATESMAHAEEGLSKFDYARFLAASLAVLAHRQGDAVGLHAVSGGELRTVEPARDRHHVHRILRELERLEPRSAWPGWDRLEAALGAGGGGRGIVVLITDFHERTTEIRSAIQRLAARRHDVLVCHLLGRNEVDFAYQGSLTFEELETGRRVEVDAGLARDAYLAALERDLRAVRDDLEDRQASYGRFLLDEPLDSALRTYLRARQRRQ